DPVGPFGPYAGFENLSMSNGRSLLQAYASGDSAYDIWSDVNGQGFEKVIGWHMTLDGKTVSSLRIGKDAFDGNQIAFWVQFTDNTSAVYTGFAPVPEPAGLFAAAAGAGALGALLRRARAARRAATRPPGRALT